MIRSQEQPVRRGATGALGPPISPGKRNPKWGRGWRPQWGRRISLAVAGRFVVRTLWLSGYGAMNNTSIHFGAGLTDDIAPFFDLTPDNARKLLWSVADEVKAELLELSARVGRT